MKKRCKILLAITLVAVMVTGCGGHVKEEIGAVVGAGVGALAGSYIGSGRRAVGRGRGRHAAWQHSGRRGREISRPRGSSGDGAYAAGSFGEWTIRGHDSLGKSGLRKCW